MNQNTYCNPNGLTALAHKGKIGRLLLNLYGGKAASYIYFKGLESYLVNECGFIQSEHDPSLFARDKGAHYIIIAVTIDDFLIAAASDDIIEEFKIAIRKKCSVKRIEPPSRYLNWTLTDDQHGGLHIWQPDEIKALLEWIRMQDTTA